MSLRGYLKAVMDHLDGGGDRTPLRNLSISDRLKLTELDWQTSSKDLARKIVREVDKREQQFPQEAPTLELIQEVQTVANPSERNALARMQHQLESQFLLPEERKPRLQNLYAITARICSTEDDQCEAEGTVGTGIIIQDKIITTGQVIRQATNKTSFQGQTLSVCFPAPHSCVLKKHKARVHQPSIETMAGVSGTPNDNDIVILEFEGDRPAIEPVIGSAKDSQGHACRLYGYTGLKEVPSTYVDGEVLRFISDSGALNRFEVFLPRLYPAMVGAGVLDLETNLLVGLLTQVEDQNRAIALDISTLRASL